MTRDNLPVKTASGDVTGGTDQTKNFVARGLEAIKSRYLDMANTGRAAAPQYNIGCEYYNKGDYVSEVRWWLKAAEQGHPDAQYKLGHAYSDGEGVGQDIAARTLGLLFLTYLLCISPNFPIPQHGNVVLSLRSSAISVRQSDLGFDKASATQ
jgi:hypothetical protein